MASVNSNYINGYHVNMNVYQKSQNIAANTSVVHYELRIYSGSSYYSGTGDTTWNTNVDGARASGAFNGFSGPNTSVLLKSGDKTVYHNADGTKKISFTGSATGKGGFGFGFSGTLKASGTLTLSTIPRASDPKWSKSLYTVGEALVINMNRKSSSFTHTGTIQIPDDNQIKSFSGIGTRYSWTPSEAEIETIYSRMPNAQKTTLGFDLQTKSGSTNIGGILWKNAKIQVNKNVVSPTFSNFTYKDTNAATVAITGNDQWIISGYSNLVATISPENKATAKYSATMKTYNATFAGRTISANYSATDAVAIDFGQVRRSSSNSSSSSNSLSVAAVDSRGLTATANKNVFVVPYSEPVVVANGQRLNNFERETTIHVEGSISPLTIDGENKNAVDATSGVQYRYREQGTSTWGEWTNLASAVGANGVVGTTDFVLALDNTKAYEFEAKITDRLETSTVNFVVSVGIPIFRIGLDKKVYNNEQPLMPSHVGQIIMSTTLDTAEKVAAIYGGTWEPFAAGRTLVGVDSQQTEFDTVGKVGGSKTVTLSVAQIPKHSHSPSSLGDNWVPNTGSMSRANFETGGSRFALSADNGQDGWKWGKTGAAGNGSAHNNLPPYIVAYIWKRTA